MTVEAKLFARLKTVAANVHPLAAPKPLVLPSVIYQRVNTDPIDDFDNEQTQAWLEFQIDTYSRSKVEADALAKIIRTSLKAWQDGDISTISYTNQHATIDDTTDVSLFRVMTFYRLFVSND